MTFLDRLLGRVGGHRRTPRAWADMEKRVADMDAQDELIARVGRQRDEALRQRDEQRALANAAAAQVEEFQQRVTEADAATAAAKENAKQAEIRATALCSDLANLTAISVPVYAPDADTQELHWPITQVMSLQARGAA